LIELTLHQDQHVLHAVQQRHYLRRLHHRFADYPLVVEVRHSSWVEPSVLDELAELGIGLCNIDQPLFRRSVKPAVVHQAKVFGRCEVKSGIAPVDRLVTEVMSQEPYKSARRVFWIMDTCSAHRGQKAAKRLRDQWLNAILVHTPVHASWLNQVEIYFSIVQRKALTPNDFSSLIELEQRLLAFQRHYEQTAAPFKWTFTRRDLHTLLAKIAAKRLAPAA
jgi:hypothetical protein